MYQEVRSAAQIERNSFQRQVSVESTQQSSRFKLLVLALGTDTSLGTLCLYSITVFIRDSRSYYWLFHPFRFLRHGTARFSEYGALQNTKKLFVIRAANSAGYD